MRRWIAAVLLVLCIGTAHADRIDELIGTWAIRTPVPLFRRDRFTFPGPVLETGDWEHPRAMLGTNRWYEDLAAVDVLGLGPVVIVDGIIACQLYIIDLQTPRVLRGRVFLGAPGCEVELEAQSTFRARRVTR